MYSLILWTNPCNQQARRNPTSVADVPSLPHAHDKSCPTLHGEPEFWLTTWLGFLVFWFFCLWALNHTVCSFVFVWLYPLFLWNWSLLFRVSLASTFLCVFCLTIPQLFKQFVSLDISLFSWGLLWIMLLWTSFNISDSAQVHVFLLGVYPGLKLLGHMGCICSFCRWCRISKVVVQICFPTSYFIELEKILKLPAFFLLWFTYSIMSPLDGCFACFFPFCGLSPVF